MNCFACGKPYGIDGPGLCPECSISMMLGKLIVENSSLVISLLRFTNTGSGDAIAERIFLAKDDIARFNKMNKTIQDA